MGFLHGKSVENTTKHMNVSETDFQYMLDCQERDVATLLVEERSLSIHQALDILYNSETYKALQNPKTGLFFQSALYVYSILSDEIDTGSLQP